MQDIRDGVAHLHSIGLVHNDLNPRNVMIAKDGAAVIIDFDWCRPTGEPLGPKGATMSWGKPGLGGPARNKDTTPESDLHILA